MGETQWKIRDKFTFLLKLMKVFNDPFLGEEEIWLGEIAETAARLPLRTTM